MPDQSFGSLTAFTDVEQKVLAHYKTWMNTWLAGRERSLEIPVGTIARPRSYLVKQTFMALPGEESTPCVIAVCDGFQEPAERRGTGKYSAYLRFGIAAMCYGNDGSARALAGHYQVALLGIATHHRTVEDGTASMCEFRDLKIDDVDEQSLGRSMCAVRLELTYKVNDFASETPVPELLPDVESPHPDDPLVETVIIDVEKEAVA